MDLHSVIDELRDLRRRMDAVEQQLSRVGMPTQPGPTGMPTQPTPKGDGQPESD